jgi:predicted dehydrogenase
MTDSPLRIGVFGAANITPMALIRPARKVPEVEIVAVAARDFGRAKKFASRHRIERVHRSYNDLVTDPEIDALYNPLPNGLHAEWSIRALEAGKHVLCEKPLAANAAEAQRMVEAAQRTGFRLIEAFHYRYHPLAARLREIVDSGVLGTIRHIETQMAAPIIGRNDIRYNYDLAGGATMDMGCYTIHLLRFLAGAEPEVVDAEARLLSPQIDRRMSAEMRFADGRSGRIVCSLWSSTVLRLKARVEGDKGTLDVFNPYVPQFLTRIVLKHEGRRTTERIRGDATYTYQLRAFAAAVRSGAPLPTEGEDSIANMRVIDAVYAAAGLPLR